ncbi:MAG: adenosylcobyric acid synthase [Parvibaculaceae bacterium]|jgi:adenosylcobyric acid synthase
MTALMFQGTGSDVGKSVLVAGLARAFVRRGLSVHPFKPQNMSNNAAVTLDGGEIGRAQWLQAIAAGVEPSIHMNPVLLKPQSDVGAQVVLHGKVIGTAQAADYQRRKQHLLSGVLSSFDVLRAQADLVLVEGAGSPAETNLRAGDIANMGFATATDTPVVLIGDIDRGGVIASLVGTHEVLSHTDRALIKGFLINKFRGDVTLFDEGLTEIETRTGWAGLGVLGWLPAMRDLPAEDGVVLERAATGNGAALTIDIPMLSRIANFDEFDPLAREGSVDLRFVPPGEAIRGTADLIILPGTKSTLADYQFLCAQGWDIDLRAHLRRGGSVLGICGGFQMLGNHITDPEGLEGTAGTVVGLGLLDMETRLKPQKEVRRVRGTLHGSPVPFEGYEIHNGVSQGPALTRPWLMKEGQQPHGACALEGNVMGAYVHGLFESGAFRTAFLERFKVSSTDPRDHIVRVEKALDDIAIAMEKDLNLDAMLKMSGA